MFKIIIVFLYKIYLTEPEERLFIILALFLIGGKFTSLLYNYCFSSCYNYLIKIWLY